MIALTEKQIHDIIKESVNKLLNEATSAKYGDTSCSRFMKKN